MRIISSPGYAPKPGRPKIRRNMLFTFCFFALTLLFTTNAHASHFRGGTLSWQKVTGQTNTVKFTVNMAWRTSSFFNPYYNPASLGATVNVGSLAYGDGSYGTIMLTVTAINTSEDWFYGTATLTKTYTYATSSSVYTASWASCCRISNLQNNRDGDMRLETTVMPASGNSSPVSTLPPIVNLARNLSSATFNIPYNDPDGDNVTFRLATKAEAAGTSYYASFVQPSNFSVNSSTGVATFNTNNLSTGSLYSAVVVVEDRDGSNNVKSKTMVDFIIKITNQSTPPAYDYSVTPSNGYTFQTSPGQKVTFDIKASDSDPNDNVTLQAIGLPTGVSFSNTLPTTNNPVSTTFSWTPTTSQLGSNVITFTAQDVNGVTTNTSVTIMVSMKPVFDVPPTLANNSSRQYEPGMNVSLDIQASDPDTNDNVQITGISGSSLPSGATLSASLPTTAANPTSTELSWTPAASDWGKHILKFRAVDTYNDYTDHNISIVVNSQPYFTSTAVTEGLAGKLYTYNIVATDPDLQYGDALEIISSSLPAWLTLTDNGDGTATLSGTPSLADAGDYNISLVAEDIHHHGYPNTPKNIQNFKLTVSACNISIASTDYSAKICYGSNNGYIKTTVTGGTAPFNYSWTGTSATTGDLSGLGEGTYTVTVTDANGCKATSDTISITTNPLPAADAGTSKEICYGEKTNIGATAVSGNTYAWTSSPAGFTSTDANPEVQPSATTTYYLTETITATGCKSSSEVTITVNPLANVSLADLDPVCVDAPAVTLNGSSDITNGNGVYSGTGVTGDKFDPATAGVGTFEITYTYTTAKGCISSAKKSITVNALPSYASLAVKDDNGKNIPNNTIFYGANGYDYANLHAQGLGNGETGKWYNGSTELTSTKVKPTATTKYKHVVTNSSGCVTTQEVTVNVLDVRCGNKMDKVTICHKGNEICVAQSAVAAHLAHGCSLGDCNSGNFLVKKLSGNENAQNNEEKYAESAEENHSENEAVTQKNTNHMFGNNGSKLANGTLKLTASPNPFSASTLIELFSSESNNISLGVYDVRGVLVSQLYNGNTEAGVTRKVNFDGSALQSGIYFVRVISGTEVQHIKLILAK